MKKRSILAICILGIVTLGLYMLVWLYRTRKEIVKTLNDPKAIPPFWVLFLPVLVLVGVVVMVLASGGEGSSNILALIIGIVAVPAAVIIPYWWIFKYSHAVDRITHGTDPVLLFVLYLLLGATGLGFVWMILVQNDINKYLERGAQSSTAPNATTPAPQPPAATPPSASAPPAPPVASAQPPAPEPPAAPQPPQTPTV